MDWIKTFFDPIERFIVACSCTGPHDKEPDEYRLDPYKNDIPYDWQLKEG